MIGNWRAETCRDPIAGNRFEGFADEVGWSPIHDINDKNGVNCPICSDI